MSGGLPPRMFEAMRRGAEKYAIGINNKTGIPSRARLIALYKKYVPHDEQGILDRTAFHKLLMNEYRNIPPQDYNPLFDYVTRGYHNITLDKLCTLLIPDGFGKERSLLDLPCTFETPDTAKESVPVASEKIRFEMVDHLQIHRMTIRQYFDGIDRDNDGCVDTRELVNALRHDNIAIGRYHACRDLVRRFDSNGRGKLSYTDFSRLMTLTTPKSQQRLSKIAAGMLTRMQGAKEAKPPSATEAMRKQQEQEAKSPQHHHRSRSPSPGGLSRKTSFGQRAASQSQSRSPKARKSPLPPPFLINGAQMQKPWAI